MRHEVPKVDIVCVPYFYGAIEHWGLVTFREDAIFIDRNNEKDLRMTYDFIGHEIAHYFYGNLVTMKRWDTYWLKEAMVSYLHINFTENYRPDLEATKNWMLDLNFEVKKAEMKPESFVVQPNEFPEDIVGFYRKHEMMFYDKAAALLRMLHHYMLRKNPEQDLFVTALKVFLKKHQFGVVDDKDFWTVMKDVSGEDIESMMTGWMTQKGFPKVEVVLTEERKTRQLILTQKRFLVDKESDPDHALWDIPVEFYYWKPGCSDCHKNGQIFRFKNITKKLFLSPASGYRSNSAKVYMEPFPILNPGQYGYYIVKYDQKLIAKIIKVFPKLDDASKIGILSDSSYLVKTEDYKIGQFLDLLTQTAQDQSNLVLAAAGHAVVTVRDWLLEEFQQNPAVYEYSKAVLSIFKPSMASNGTRDTVERINQVVIPNTDYILDNCLIKGFGFYIRGNKSSEQIISEFFELVKEKNVTKSALKGVFDIYECYSCKEETRKSVWEEFLKHFDSILAIFETATEEEASNLGKIVKTVILKAGNFEALKAFKANYTKAIELIKPQLDEVARIMDKATDQSKSIEKWMARWERKFH
ncbi:hypothetical protein L596_029976 [Steinernema carpocapsae]|uniref:Peptidase M1 membrane alanine aminopeptidase domain-containing protein n=1 Tax=Steinernema carpocapsae TaxID=34508 RepID=A0A4U5LRD7_STECR|nr:hypothetical protein L596_029976 [Steinernema carpocapsae]